MSIYMLDSTTALRRATEKKDYYGKKCDHAVFEVLTHRFPHSNMTFEECSNMDINIAMLTMQDQHKRKNLIPPDFTISTAWGYERDEYDDMPLPYTTKFTKDTLDVAIKRVAMEELKRITEVQREHLAREEQYGM